MIKVLLIVCFVTFSSVAGQTWVSRARLNNTSEYWTKLMQETIYQVEAREWCNLKQNDITQTIDDNLYNMRVTGTVKYTNGFVVSIQKIDTEDIDQMVTSRTVDGEAVPFGTVSGKLNFRDMIVGYDVYANLTSPEGEYRVTGTFKHTLVQVQLYLTQNLITKELSSSNSVLSTSFGSGARMHYMPSSHITEALSRRFAHSTFSSATNWARNIFEPIMINLATNELGFPEVCFNNCVT